MNMKIPFFLQYIILFASLLFYFTAKAALTNEQKGMILDNFKDRQQELLFETNVGDFESEDLKIFDTSNRMNIFWDIATKIEYERGTIEDKQVYELGKILSLQESLETLENDISTSTNNVNKINGKIIEIKNDIELNKKSLDLVRNKIEENRKILLKYLQYIYKKSNNIYIDDKFDNLKWILLNDETVSDMINDLYYKNIIQITGEQLIEKHKKLVAQMYTEKLELEKNEKDLKQLRKLEVIDRKILSDKKEFKERLLEVSQGKQALYEEFIDDKLELEKKVKLQAFKEKARFEKIQKDLLWKYDCEFVNVWDVDIEELNLDPQCEELNKVLYAEERLQKTQVFQNNFLDWPVNPKVWISAFFKWIDYKNMFGADHDAIDLAVTQWTPIKAPADWYVLYLNPPDTSDYSFMAIKHAEWYVTVYGHLSEIDVKPFEFVRRGQIIGKSGWEYGSKGAWLMTTGPHLHFEVFQDEKPIDPLNVLDLSYANYSNLPEKYLTKFQTDFRVRKWYAYKAAVNDQRIFRLDWYSEIERQKDLIAKYTAPAFRNWEMWVDESLNGNIDPTFTMCIWLAESWLWRNLKTPFNVWNIGNTDSGAVREYQSAREWVYMMIHTLNNRYLGHYNEIRLLSRYGNPDGTIYASSPDHWHNNIIKCMSAIKWYQVPDDYNFRLGQQ